MYTVFISNSQDELKQLLKNLCDTKELFREEGPAPDPDFSQYCRIGTAKELYSIPYREILFIESYQKKTLLHFKDKEMVLPFQLGHFIDILPLPHFMQCHRSYIINLKNISYIDKSKEPWTVSFFDSDKTAFISRNFRQPLVDAISPYLQCVIE